MLAQGERWTLAKNSSTAEKQDFETGTFTGTDSTWAVSSSDAVGTAERLDTCTPPPGLGEQSLKATTPGVTAQELVSELFPHGWGRR